LEPRERRSGAVEALGEFGANIKELMAFVKNGGSFEVVEAVKFVWLHIAHYRI